MKPATKAWVQKAEGDFVVAEREFRARKLPNYDDTCFHVQQCIEKYLKARLQEAGEPIPKIHDLSTLLDLVMHLEPLWEPFRTDLEKVSSYAVVFRYPGESADKEDARAALRKCRAIRRMIRESFGLKDPPKPRKKQR